MRTNGWDAQRGFWLGGHTADGAPVHEQRPDAARVLLQGVFSPQQIDTALDRIAGPNFQTDWGVRSLASDDPDYDPNPYGQGSVWALGTSGVAGAFWGAHRPQTAWAAWHGLLAWATLDSPGRLHEVVAGDLFHPEIESVPEQTWSSAGLMTGAVGGLLGLERHALDGALTFAPHLPADWGEVSVRRLRVGASRLDLRMTQDTQAVTLDVRNDGPPVTLAFVPEIPLGARLIDAEVDGALARVAIERHAQDQHARLSVRVGPGGAHIRIRYAGGVRIAPLVTPLEAGDRSRNMKVATARWVDGALSLKAYVVDPAHNVVDLITSMAVAAVEGADASRTAPNVVRLTLHPQPAVGGVAAPTEVVVRLQGSPDR